MLCVNWACWGSGRIGRDGDTSTMAPPGKEIPAREQGVKDINRQIVLTLEFMLATTPAGYSNSPCAFRLPFCCSLLINRQPLATDRVHYVLKGILSFPCSRLIYRSWLLMYEFHFSGLTTYVRYSRLLPEAIHRNSLLYLLLHGRYQSTVPRCQSTKKAIMEISHQIHDVVSAAWGTKGNHRWIWAGEWSWWFFYISTPHLPFFSEVDTSHCHIHCFFGKSLTFAC